MAPGRGKVHLLERRIRRRAQQVGLLDRFVFVFQVHVAGNDSAHLLCLGISAFYVFHSVGGGTVAGEEGLQIAQDKGERGAELAGDVHEKACPPTAFLLFVVQALAEHHPGIKDIKEQDYYKEHGKSIRRFCQFGGIPRGPEAQTQRDFTRIGETGVAAVLGYKPVAALGDIHIYNRKRGIERSPFFIETFETVSPIDRRHREQVEVLDLDGEIPLAGLQFHRLQEGQAGPEIPRAVVHEYHVERRLSRQRGGLGLSGRINLYPVLAAYPHGAVAPFEETASPDGAKPHTVRAGVVGFHLSAGANQRKSGTVAHKIAPLRKRRYAADRIVRKSGGHHILQLTVYQPRHSPSGNTYI